jgi:hypothetical protein
VVEPALARALEVLDQPYVVVLDRLVRNRMHPATHTEVMPLESYVEALGGRLRLVAELEDMSIALQ